MTETVFDPLSPQRNPLNKLIDGTLGPLSRLSETIDLTLEQVSQWIAHPDNRRQISNLVTLLDAQTQLIICQHRLIAAVRLSDVARSQASPEVVRRACADLLKLRLIDPYKEDKRPEKLPPPRQLSEDKVLEALERLGRESNPDWVAQQRDPNASHEGLNGFSVTPNGSAARCVQSMPPFGASHDRVTM